MRFIIYDDETFEPITVVNIRGLTERDIESHGRRWRILVPEESTLRCLSEAEMRSYRPPRTVDIWFEQFCRQHPRNGRQDSWMAFTRATELAMLLDPDWLPGQRSAVDSLVRQNNALVEMLMVAMSR